MNTGGFIFDVIITGIKAKGYVFNDSEALAITATFNGISLAVTASRLSMYDFKRKRGFEINKSTDKLRQEMQNSPLLLTVRYNGNIVGYGEMVWPESVLAQINSPANDDIMHAGRCALKNRGKNVGFLKLVVLLQITRQNTQGDLDFEYNVDQREFILLIHDDQQEQDSVASRAIKILHPPSSQSSNARNLDDGIDVSRVGNINGEFVRAIHTPSQVMPMCYQHLMDSINEPNGTNHMVPERNISVDNGKN